MRTYIVGTNEQSMGLSAAIPLSTGEHKGNRCTRSLKSQGGVPGNVVKSQFLQKLYNLQVRISFSGFTNILIPFLIFTTSMVGLVIIT